MSGMIFVALAVVWAVYLIPRAVNRSEDELALLPAGWGEPEAPEERSSKRARKQADAGSPVQPAASPRPLTKAEAVAVRTAVLRRRRVLLTLLAITGITGIVSLVSPLAGWAAAVPGGLVLIWLVVCRVQVRRLEARRAERLAAEALDAAADEKTEQSEQAAVAGAASEAAAPAEAVPAQRTFRVEIPDTPAALVVEPDEDTIGLTADDRAAALADEMPRGAVWDPRPLTLPTYIAKPRARRVPRTLALDEAGVSSSGRDARDSALVAEGAYAGVDATARPRQAVGS